MFSARSNQSLLSAGKVLVLRSASLVAELEVSSAWEAFLSRFLSLLLEPSLVLMIVHVLFLCLYLLVGLVHNFVEYLWLELRRDENLERSSGQ